VLVLRYHCDIQCHVVRLHSVAVDRPFCRVRELWVVCSINIFIYPLCGP